MREVMQCVFEMRADVVVPVSVSTRGVRLGAQMCSRSVSAYKYCLQAPRGNKGSAPPLGTLERVNEAHPAIARPFPWQIEGAR